MKLTCDACGVNIADVKLAASTDDGLLCKSCAVTQLRSELGVDMKKILQSNVKRQQRQLSGQANPPVLSKNHIATNDTDSDRAVMASAVMNSTVDYLHKNKQELVDTIKSLETQLNRYVSRVTLLEKIALTQSGVTPVEEVDLMGVETPSVESKIFNQPDLFDEAANESTLLKSMMTKGQSPDLNALRYRKIGNTELGSDSY